MRRWWMGCLAALLALGLTVQPVLASGTAMETRAPGLTCVDGMCRARLNLGLEHGWLQVAEGALSRLPGGEWLLSDDVLLALPTGSLQLADAELRFRLDESGRVATLRGSAMLPLPLFGLLGDAQLITPARVDVGVERGSELGHLTAPLDPTRRYFFVEMQAGMGLAVGGVDLAVPIGQAATLVVDFTQPMVFIDGTITLRSDGQLAMVSEWLDGAREFGLPSELPLRQIASFHVQGQWGRDVAAHLSLESALRVDGGMMGRWLQIDAIPLLARGRAVLAADGLRFEGALQSSIAPEQAYATAVQAEVYVPFAAPETTSLTLRGQTDVPLIGLATSGATTMAGEPGWALAWADGAWSSMVAGTRQVGVASVDGTVWVGDQIGQGSRRLAEDVVSGWDGARGQWCGLTGMCRDEPVAADPIEISLAK